MTLRAAAAQKTRRGKPSPNWRAWAPSLDSSADAIIGMTPAAVITSWNPGAEKLYGYAAAEVMGRDIRFLIPDHLLRGEESLARRNPAER